MEYYIPSQNCHLKVRNYDLEAVKKILEEDPSIKNPDTSSTITRSPICLALRCNASETAIQELLKAGCSPNACKKHKSILQCASDHKNTQFKTEVLTLLIRVGANLAENDELGRSPLCYGLKRSADLDFINLLFSKGCSITSCTFHESALICLMYREANIILTAEIVKILSEEGVNPHVSNLQALEILYPVDMALRSGIYETSAIEALIDLVESFLPQRDYDHWSKTALFSAVQNEQFKVGTIELLISKGCDPSFQDSISNSTALHLVVRLPTCSTAVLKVLTNNNDCKNSKDTSKKTPLMLCIEHDNKESHAASMFADGCRINNKKVCSYLHIRMSNINISSFQEPKKLRYYKLLLKFSLLEEPDFNEYSFVRSEKFPHFYNFAEACSAEISQMMEVNISERLTLYDFVVRDRDASENPIVPKAHRRVSLNRLLKKMSPYKFNIYCDVIAAYFPLKEFKKTLQEMMVFLSLPNSLPDGENMPLNCEVILSLCDYLSPGDALRLIIAYMPPFIPPR